MSIKALVMAKNDKKNITHKAMASNKGAKSSNNKSNPKLTQKVINKGPKVKLDSKNKPNKFDTKNNKIQKNERDTKNSKSKSTSFGASNNKFSHRRSDVKSPAVGKKMVVAPVKGPKKEIKIEHSSKQEYLKKKELKKIAHEKNQQLRKEQTNKSDVEVKAKSTVKVQIVETVTTSKGKKVDPKAAKKGKTKPKEEGDLDDVFIDDIGSSEIDEYEAELKAVEELDNENDEDVVIEAEGKEKKFEDIELTDAEGNKLCRARDCDQVAAVEGYCRYHYLLYWKRIQIRKKILADGKLGRYIDELTSRYPDKFLEMIRRDLRTQKDFLSAIQELEIDESAIDNDYEEDTQSFIDEVRGMNESSSLTDEDFE